MRVEIVPVEVLATRNTIIDAVIRMGHGAEDQVDLVHELGPAERKMKPRAGVEHNDTPIWIEGAGVIKCHPEQHTRRLGRFSRIGRPDACPGAHAADAGDVPSGDRRDEQVDRLYAMGDPGVGGELRLRLQRSLDRALVE
ncbi:MAG: hypothetical protein ACRDK7_15255 [Solirubrobacteraceae bacterium]